VKDVAMKFSIGPCTIAVAAIALLNISAANAATETVVYSFCSQSMGQPCPDGYRPYSGTLIDVSGKLYGTTLEGGQFGNGTLFRFDPETKILTVLHSFASGDDGYGGNGLFNSNGVLYGTSDGGGTYGAGTVFSFDLKTKSETVLHTFTGGSDGGWPEMEVPVEVKGVLYGTTAWGGTYGFGNVFSIDPKSGTETVLHSFQSNGSDGNSPWTGTTQWGGTGLCGPSGCGTLYSVNPQNGTYAVLYSFNNNSYDITAPSAPLLNYKGILYGTGASGPGIFTFNPQTNVETVIKSGGETTGSFGIFVSMNGKLYGTTDWAGNSHTCYEDSTCGNVFSVNLHTGVGKSVYSFRDKRSDGYQPLAGLVELNGVLYGTTTSGGANGGGTIFSVKP
jgi:uncharacterized repeat protein (TIGR03803 family)